MITDPIISSLTEGKPPWSMFNRDPPGQLVIQKRNQDQLSSIAVFWGRGANVGDWEVKQEVELSRDSSHNTLLTQGHLRESSAGMGRQQPSLILQEMPWIG